MAIGRNCLWWAFNDSDGVVWRAQGEIMLPKGVASPSHLQQTYVSRRKNTHSFSIQSQAAASRSHISHGLNSFGWLRAGTQLYRGLPAWALNDGGLSRIERGASSVPGFDAPVGPERCRRTCHGTRYLPGSPSSYEPAPQDHYAFLHGASRVNSAVAEDIAFPFAPM
jgi:hypothetical protein